MQMKIRQLWERVQILHDATPSLRPLVGSHSGFIPPTSDEATAAAAPVAGPADAGPCAVRGLLRA